jgi:hypothetical protein
MVTNQSTLISVGETRSIEEIRKRGLDNQLKEMIATERAEMQRIKDQAKERLPGQFISLRQDKETRTFLFTGQWQKLQVPAKDFTKQEIPGKTVTKYRFQVYDLTTFDSNNPPEAAIWGRGTTEADQIFYWFEKGVTELTIMRNGGPNSKSTTYNIFPTNR